MNYKKHMDFESSLKVGDHVEVRILSVTSAPIRFPAEIITIWPLSYEVRPLPGNSLELIPHGEFIISRLAFGSSWRENNGVFPLEETTE